MKLLFTLLLCTMTLACGYGSKATTPAQPGATPTLTQLNPSSVIAGSGAFQLEVIGANFSSNAVINFNGVAQPTALEAVGKLAAQVPNTAVAMAGSVAVTVTNPATPGGIYGGGTTAVTSQPMTFTIN